MKFSEIITVDIELLFSFSIDIICFFAAKGFWPFYPSMLQYQVNEMGKKVFSLSDDRIRQFCCGKFNFQETCYRPGMNFIHTLNGIFWAKVFYIRLAVFLIHFL